MGWTYASKGHFSEVYNNFSGKYFTISKLYGPLEINIKNIERNLASDR